MRKRKVHQLEGDTTITVVWIGWMHLAYLVGIATGFVVGLGLGVLLS